MSFTVNITLTSAGSLTGPFDIYGNTDLITPIVNNVDKYSLLLGYMVTVPDNTTYVRVQSNSIDCSNYIDIEIINIPSPTPTPTVSPSPTPTTPEASYTPTPTITPTPTMTPTGITSYDNYYADKYDCSTCTLVISNELVAFPTGQSVNIGSWYPDTGAFSYLIQSSTLNSGGHILTNVYGSFVSCNAACLV